MKKYRLTVSTKISRNLSWFERFFYGGKTAHSFWVTQEIEMDITSDEEYQIMQAMSEMLKEEGKTVVMITDITPNVIQGNFAK